MPKLSRKQHTLAGLLALTVLAGCSNRETPLAPQPLLPSAQSQSDKGIRVMSRNVYQGFSTLGPLADPSLPPSQVPFVVAGIWSQIVATDFPSRAERLADEVARNRPHLIGLQEVSRYRMQVPADGALNATEDVYDFLALLLDALADRGLDYRVAAVAQNLDVEMPMIFTGSPIGLADVRLTDRDVILVRGDVAWNDAQAGNYAAKFPLPVGGTTIVVARGWTSIRARIEDRELRFVNTHLEAFVPAIQVLQAQELLAMLASETDPVALVGDLNSEADGSTTPSYGMAIAAGFADAWLPRGRGETCCHEPDLRIMPSHFDERIDFVLLRGDFGLGSPGLEGGVHSELTGIRPSERTPDGLWPSDHAGIVTTLRFKNR